MLSRRHFRLFAATLIGVQLALLGCDMQQKANGKDGDVKIATPFGGLSVKTDGASVQQGLGLAIYPGATPEKKDSGKNEAADINMSFGNFHLGVKAVSFTTPDPPAKLLAFYRKELARFGVVIDCRDHKPVGSPARTPEGLTCESDDSQGHGAKLNINDDDFSEELKAGSKRHQHIVAVEPKGDGTKFGLVVLDLPEQLEKRSGDASAARQ